jgi:hypothetical protein
VAPLNMAGLAAGNRGMTKGDNPACHARLKRSIAVSQFANFSDGGNLIAVAAALKA